MSPKCTIKTDGPFLIPEKNLYLTAGGLYCLFELQQAAVKAGEKSRGTDENPYKMYRQPL